MSKKKFSQSVYHYEHYSKTPVNIEPQKGGYYMRLFKDHYHKTVIKIDIPDNVSDLIYGK
jgi:hypothetical protein